MLFLLALDCREQQLIFNISVDLPHFQMRKKGDDIFFLGNQRYGCIHSSWTELSGRFVHVICVGIYWKPWGSCCRDFFQYRGFLSSLCFFSCFVQSSNSDLLFLLLFEWYKQNTGKPFGHLSKSTGDQNASLYLPKELTYLPNKMSNLINLADALPSPSSRGSSWIPLV